MTDHDVRQRLNALARSYGDADDLRARVRRHIETLESSPTTQLAPWRPPPKRRTQVLLVAATVAAGVVALGGLVLLGNGNGTVSIEQSTTSTAVVATGSLPATDRRVVVTATQPSVRFELPADTSLELVSESSTMSEFRLGGADPTSARLVVIVPSVDDVASVEESLEWLESSLSQTSIDSVDSIDVGEQPGVTIGMSPDAGLVLNGFRFGSRTFISASGIDRTYEATIVEREGGGIVVIWIDAPEESFDEAAAAADVALDRLVTTG